MTRTGHQALGAVTGLAVAQVSGWNVLQAGAALILATITSAGWFSPDVDQLAWWQAMDRWLPDELLGDNGPLQHRGITHWWFLPFAVWRSLDGVDAAWTWAALALLAGWVSHLAGDFVFGLAGGGRDAGIPLGPWFWHIGLGVLSASGWVEATTSWLLLGAALYLSLTMIGVPL